MGTAAGELPERGVPATTTLYVAANKRPRYSAIGQEGTVGGVIRGRASHITTAVRVLGQRSVSH